MNKTLTVIIIAKNEEVQIENCLKSASFADETVLIDTGSTDSTIKIAKKYTKKIFQTEFTDFSKIRNFAKSKVNSEWVFYLDADEEISSDLRDEIKKTISSTDSLNAYFVTRQNYFLGKMWPTKDRLQRLFKNKKLTAWYGRVHETPKYDGEASVLQGLLVHKTHNSLEEMLQNTIVWSDFEAKARYDANHPKIVWWRIFRVMITQFFDTYITQKGYKVGVVGLIESIYQSYSIFVTYAKLWELQTLKKS